MSCRRICVMAISVAGAAALLALPAAVALAITLEWWHTRNYDVNDVFGED